MLRAIIAAAVRAGTGFFFLSVILLASAGALLRHSSSAVRRDCAVHGSSGRDCESDRIGRIYKLVGCWDSD